MTAGDLPPDADGMGMAGPAGVVNVRGARYISSWSESSRPGGPCDHFAIIERISL
jgi:hypothetical protein